MYYNIFKHNIIFEWLSVKKTLKAGDASSMMLLRRIFFVRCSFHVALIVIMTMLCCMKKPPLDMC